MGEFTLLGLLSPFTLCTIKSISVGSGGIQYLHMSGQPGVNGVPETALPFVSNGDDCVKNEITETNLANYIPRFSRNRYQLVRRSQIVFREIQLKEREMMLILSCTTPIIVHTVRGKRVLYSLLAKYKAQEQYRRRYIGAEERNSANKINTD